MTRAAFRQADIERILRAAKAVGATVQIDLRTLACTILPTHEGTTGAVTGPAPFGKEDWSDFPARPRPYGKENWDDD